MHEEHFSTDTNFNSPVTAYTFVAEIKASCKVNLLGFLAVFPSPCGKFLHVSEEEPP